MDPQLVILQDRKRANLARIAQHDQYLVHIEPDGTLIWEPAEIVSVAERKLLEHARLMAVIAANRADPSRLRTRDRSKSPRSTLTWPHYCSLPRRTSFSMDLRVTPIDVGSRLYSTERSTVSRVILAMRGVAGVDTRM